MTKAAAPEFDRVWSRRWQSNKWGSIAENQIPLHIGELDFKPPEPVRAKIVEAADWSPSAYCWSPGIPEVRQAIAELYRRRGRAVESGDVYLTQGTKLGLKLTLEAILKPGDRVVVVGAPAYKLVVSGAFLAKANIEFIPLLRHGDSWCLDLDALRAATQGRVAAIIYNSPHNPFGYIFSRSEVDAIAEAGLRTGAVIIADEINEFLTYDKQHYSITESDPEAQDKVLAFSSFSKAFGIGGYRVGHLIHRGSAMSEIDKCLKQRLIQASTLSQFAAWGCANAAETWLPELKALLLDNLAICEKTLLPLLGKDYVRPDAGFSIWIPLPHHEGSEGISDDILRQTAISVVDERGYENPIGKGFRISFGTHQSVMREAMDRLEYYLQSVLK